MSPEERNTSLIRAALLASLAALAGCPDPHPGNCKVGFIGTEGSAPEARMLATDGIGALVEVNDGDTVPLVPPLQGGEVLFIGAFARNLDGCNAETDARLVFPDNGIQIGHDARTHNFVVGSDGWGGTDPSNVIFNTANVNVCGNFSSRPVMDVPLRLEMTVTDRNHRTAKVTRTVVPRCQLADPVAQELCLCECAPNFFLGRCKADGGTDGGSADL